MKHIILFKGGVETLEFFSIEMARTFRQQGYDIFWFDLIFCTESSKKLKSCYSEWMKEASSVYALTFNFGGLAGEEGLYTPDGVSFWDETNIRVYNIVVDHPLYYHKYEKFLPDNYIQLGIDRNHVRYMDTFFPKIQNAFFPLAGTGLYSQELNGIDKPFIPWKDRKIDILFTGNYTPLEQLVSYLAGMDEEYKQFYINMVKELMEHPKLLVEDVAKQYLEREIGRGLTIEELKPCMPNMMFVDLSIRFYYRAKVLQTLLDDGMKVHIIGAGWDLLECRHPENMILHGNQSSQACLDAIAQAKISINVMPWFKDGAHDRIFNSMLNGAISLSDDSCYLREIFNDQEDICYYALEDIPKITQKATYILQNTEYAEIIQKNAYKKCIREHTWQKRAEWIIQDIIRYEMWS